MSNESTILIKYKLDKSSAQATQDKAKGIGDTLGLMGTRADDASSSAKQLGKALKLGRPEAVIKQATQGMQGLEDATKGAARSVEQLNDAFGQTSRNVALAGDVESNLRTLGGAAGAVGFGGAAGGIGVAAEVPALVEALPRLKTALAGLPASVKAAASEIGVAGGGLLAGLAALAIGFKLLGDAAKKAEQEVIKQGAAEREWTEFLATATEEQIRERRRGNEVQLAIEKELNQERAQNAQETAEQLNFAQRNWRALGINLDTTAGQVEGANQLWKESADNVANLTEENEKLDDIIAQMGGTASTTTLQLADAAAQRLQLEQELATMGQEAANARLQSLQNEKAVLLAQIQVLKASGDTSEEVVKRIQDLEGQLKSLDSSIAQVSNHIGSGAAKAVDSAAKQKQAQEQAAQAAEQAAQRIQQAHQQYADAIENINRQTSQAVADANRKLSQSLKDLKQTLSEDMTDALQEANLERLKMFQDANRDEQKEARDNQRELKNMRKEAQRSERDAIRSRSFLALADLAERTKDELDDTKERLLEERKERDIAFRFALSDQKEAEAKQRMDRLKDYQKQRQDLRKNLSRQLDDLHRGAQRQLENAARARDKQLQIAQQGANALLQVEADLWARRKALAEGRKTRKRGRRTPTPGTDTLGLLQQLGLA